MISITHPNTNDNTVHLAANSGAVEKSTYFNPYGNNEYWRGILADRKLSSGAKLVLNDLIYRNKSGVAYPSIKTIGKDIGAEPRSVRRHIKELTDNGYITVIEVFEGKEQLTNQYVFIAPGHGRETAKRAKAKAVYAKNAKGTITRASVLPSSCPPPAKFDSPPRQNMSVKGNKSKYKDKEDDLESPPEYRENRDTQPESPGFTYLKAELRRYLGVVQPPTDREVSRLIHDVSLAAGHDVRESEVIEDLAQMHKEGLSRGSKHGPRCSTYSWFLTVLPGRFHERRKRREASPAFVPASKAEYGLTPSQIAETASVMGEIYQ